MKEKNEKIRWGLATSRYFPNSTLVASFRTWPGTQTENTREPNPITEIVCGLDSDYLILIPEKCKSFLVQNVKNDTVCLFFVNCVVKMPADV